MAGHSARLLWIGLASVAVGVWPAAAPQPSQVAASLPPLPVGIPKPPFGLAETVLARHRSPTFHTHWIDNTSSSCTDTSNPAGTSKTPRCSFPSLSALSPGDVVQVRGGPYKLGGNLTIGGAGTAADPIFVTTQGKAAVELALAGVHSVQILGSHIMFEGFKTTGQDEAIVIRGHHVGFRDNEVVGTGTAADGNGAMIALGGSDHVVVFRNTIHEGGAWQSPIENDMHGLGVGTNQTSTWYLNNTVYHVAGDAIGNGHNANQTTSGLYIGGNTMYECRENAIDLKEVHDVIISENRMHGFVASGSSEGAAVVAHYGPTRGEGPHNVWTINNLIHDNAIGYSGSDNEAGHYFIGNVFYNNGVAMSLNATGGGEYHFLHNTMVDNGVGQWWGVTTDSLIVGGNIVANATAGAHLRVDTSAERARAEVKNELYYQGGRDVTILWATRYGSVSTWTSRTDAGHKSLQKDPRFVDAAGRDYRLQAGSPAIDAGLDMSGVAKIFRTAFGTSLLTDRAGTPRPNGVWDIGAYER